MGLDTSHGCWRGAYSAFHRWRQGIAQAAGMPPLELMEGFIGPEESDMDALYIGPLEGLWRDKLMRLRQQLPIRWKALKPDPLHELLRHSDCEGELPWESCGPIADRLESLLPELEKIGDVGGHIGVFAEKTRTFIEGLRRAHEARENVGFR